jgi:hypothetical protein
MTVTATAATAMTDATCINEPSDLVPDQRPSIAAVP